MQASRQEKDRIPPIFGVASGVLRVSVWIKEIKMEISGYNLKVIDKIEVDGKLSKPTMSIK